MTSKYNTEPALLYNEACGGDFDKVTISKELILDLNSEILHADGRSNGWGRNFTREYLSDELISWLQKRDFEVDVVNDKDGYSLKYYIRFANETTKLEYLLKFNPEE